MNLYLSVYDDGSIIISAVIKSRTETKYKEISRTVFGLPSTTSRLTPSTILQESSLLTPRITPLPKTVVPISKPFFELLKTF